MANCVFHGAHFIDFKYDLRPVKRLIDSTRVPYNRVVYYQVVEKVEPNPLKRVSGLYKWSDVSVDGEIDHMKSCMLYFLMLRAKAFNRALHQIGSLRYFCYKSYLYVSLPVIRRNHYIAQLWVVQAIQDRCLYERTAFKVCLNVCVFRLNQ